MRTSAIAICALGVSVWWLPTPTHWNFHALTLSLSCSLYEANSVCGEFIFNLTADTTCQLSDSTIWNKMAYVFHWFLRVRIQSFALALVRSRSHIGDGDGARWVKSRNDWFDRTPLLSSTHTHTHTHIRLLTHTYTHTDTHLSLVAAVVVVDDDDDDCDVLSVAQQAGYIREGGGWSGG